MSADRGLIQVYTGNGKGKTTAALGQGLRAVGHGMRVVVVQFMKGSPSYGELTASSFLPGFKIFQVGRHEFVDKQNPDPVDVAMAQDGYRLAQRILLAGECDMLILDEINVALDFGLLDWHQVKELVGLKPPQLDLVLTGRYAPPALLEMADLVTEMVEVKHHYQAGVQARAGIEF